MDIDMPVSRENKSKALAAKKCRSVGAKQGRAAPSSSRNTATDLAKLRELVVGLGVQRIAELLLEQDQQQAFQGTSRQPRAASSTGTRAVPGGVENKKMTGSGGGRKLGAAPAGESLTNSDDFRKYRGDVVAHYPFVDSTGSVASLLKENPDHPETEGGEGDGSKGDRHSPEQGLIHEVNVLNVPAPQGRRMMRRAFDEFRVGRDSLRVADIPAALESIGLAVTPGLSGALFGPRETASADIPAYVSFDQWLHVVYHAAKSRINREHKGAPMRSIAEVSTEAAGDSVSGDYEEHDEEGNERDKLRVLPESTGVPTRAARRRGPAERHSGPEQWGGRASKIATKSSASAQLGQRSPLQRQIAADKARYFNEKRKFSAAAARKIAESRLSSLESEGRRMRGSEPDGESVALKEDYKARPYYWRDAAVGETPIAPDRDGAGEWHAEELLPYDRYNPRAAERRGGRIERISKGKVSTDEKFLHSGRAALEIATSFLDSQLGHQIMRGEGLSLSSSTAEGEDYSIEEDGSDDSLRGKEQVIEKTETKLFSLFEDLKPFTRPVSVPAVVAPKSRTRDSDVRPNSFADEGWRKARGGWVADFGPLHTRTLSIEDVRNKAFIPKSKQKLASALPKDPLSSTNCAPSASSHNESVSLNDYILKN